MHTLHTLWVQPSMEQYMNKFTIPTVKHSASVMVLDCYKWKSWQGTPVRSAQERDHEW
jgi:hypothetical protein